MANKFDGDVRPLSNDQRYMGVVFQGSIDDAIFQAHGQDDFGLAEQPARAPRINRDRWNLLEHLNLAPHFSEDALLERAYADTDEDWSVEYGAPEAPAAQYSPYSLEHAIQRGWIVPHDVPRVQVVNQPHPMMLHERFDALTDAQFDVYWQARLTRGVRDSLAYAEQYPYPVAQS